jgi:serine/threonine protein phosphatase 1
MNNKWQKFEKNEVGRDFAVGDIHGYFHLVRLKMLELKFDKEKDRLFSLGDLIDRGPDSIKVLEWLKEPWFFPIKGNHEVMVCEYYTGKDWKDSYAGHGGQWFIDLPMYEQLEYVEKLNKLPHVFEIDTVNGLVGLVHAEVPVYDWWTFKTNYDEYEERSLWSFDLFKKACLDVAWPVANIDWIIHGHSSVAYPSKVENKIYIDTGATSKKLTFLEINNPKGMIAHHGG